MIRKIIKINRETCNGCGLCVSACHEGAIGMEDSKAVLLRDDYCDGLGDCLPVCPTGAISFEERDALPYNEAAVQALLRKANGLGAQSGCPGAALRTLSAAAPDQKPAVVDSGSGRKSSLRQWPVQIKLTPAYAAYFKDANLLVAADCCAYAYNGFHERFMHGNVTVIGCPKLDGVDYAPKLAEIFSYNAIKSITIARMSVPCCGGMEQAVMRAIRVSGKDIVCRAVTISPEAKIVSDRTFPPQAEEGTA